VPSQYCWTKHIAEECCLLRCEAIWLVTANVGSYKSYNRNIPEDGIANSHRHENLKSYIALTGLALQRRRDVFPMRFELGFLYPRRRHSS
jgi:hypothetical protein